jgi:spore germination protein KA
MVSTTQRWIWQQEECAVTNRQHHGKKGGSGHSPEPDWNLEEEILSANIETNEAFLKRVFNRCSDLVLRTIDMEGEQPKRLIAYLGTLADETKVNELIIKPLTLSGTEYTAGDAGQSPTFGKRSAASEWEEVVRHILRGYAALFTDGENSARCYPVNAALHRSIEEPPSEPVIRGPREGFVERQQLNVGLLRNYIVTPNLKLEDFTVGRLTQTNVLLAYIEGLADTAVIERIRKKITGIKVEGVLESGYIEELIRDDPFPLFPVVLVTERPDAVAGALLEGRAAILVDNTPFVMVVPITFWSGLQASEDYYLRYPIATFARWIRFIFLLVAVFAPSFFVAVTSFHQEMIPTSLLLSIASAREPVPLPIMIEALIMEIIFEALREAGVRLPKPIGQTVSIVGALVLGQAAVQAGLISTPILIVVSTTGIAAFLIPRFTYANGVRLLRFPMILLAGSLGLYGIALGFLAVLLRLVHLKSFGVPYFAPLAPFSLRALKDVVVRAPIENDLNGTIPENKRTANASGRKEEHS